MQITLLITIATLGLVGIKNYVKVKNLEKRKMRICAIRDKQSQCNANFKLAHFSADATIHMALATTKLIGFFINAPILAIRQKIL